MLNCAQYLLNVIQHKLSFELVDDEVIFSKNEIINYVNIISKQLQEQNVKPGDAILVSSNLGNLYWVCCLAIWSTGAILVPLDNTANPEYLLTIINAVKPVLIIGNNHCSEDINSNCKKFIPNINCPNEKNFSLPKFKYNELAAILFTSGTTGDPKGVQLTHAMILQNSLATSTVAKISPTARLLVISAKHFTSTLCHFVFACLNVASFITTTQKLFPKDICSLLIAKKATAFGGSPIQLQWIINSIESDLSDSEILENITWIMSSGDNLNPDLSIKLLNHFKNLQLFVAYGLTELAGRFCILPSHLARTYPGSVGYPIPGLTIKILDENKQIAAPNKTGEIYVVGDYIFSGYLDKPELSQEFITSAGLKTGDMGYVNERGLLYLSGRKDDVFKCAGKKVSTLKISNVIQALNLFEDFVIIPIPDEQLGHIPCLCYVSDNMNLSRGMILKMLREHLSGVDLPKRLIKFDSIPRRGIGKVDRNMLIDLINKNLLNDEATSI
ncbi:MAG: acyl--CoA ligase [Legionellales bacterium]|nr:acyl--CoA ligase [Legionellales bacterium]